MAGAFDVPAPVILLGPPRRELASSVGDHDADSGWTKRHQFEAQVVTG